MKKCTNKEARGGYTLVEMMFGSMIMTLAIAGALTLMVNTLRTQQRLEIKSLLDSDLEKSVEHIRQDMRLSSTGVGLLAWYPAGGVEYSAVSMPIGGDADGDGMIDRNDDDTIKWYATVIYHVAPGTPDKLRRTVFAPRNNTNDAEDYYNQLKGVVEASDPSEYANDELSGETVTSEVIFENLVSMTFRPPQATFDGYAPSRGQKRFNFGAVLLHAGNHYLQLISEQKNAASSDYNMIVDQMAVSGSGTPREAELYVPLYQHPSWPYFYLYQTGGSISGLRGPEWKGDAAIYYEPNSTPATLAFHIYNDLWCDDGFLDPPAEEALNCSPKIDQTFAASYPYIFDRIVSMDKGIAWTASSAAPTEGTNVYTVDMSVEVPLYGADALQPYAITRNGRWVRFAFERMPAYRLRISDVLLTDLASGDTAAVTFDGGDPQAKLDPSDPITVTSDWVEEWEIQRTNTYQLSYLIEASSGDPAGTTYWTPTVATNLTVINGVPAPGIPALISIEVGYPDTAIYRSRPFDTQTDDPSYRYLSWKQDEFFSEGGDIDMRIRAGDQPDMSDADWTDAYSSHDGYFQSNNRNSLSSLPHGRYVQYEALFTCGRGGAIPQAHITTTPILRDVTIEWDGPKTLTDVVVDFGTGPDCGIVRATVDGVALVRALEVDMEIYQDGLVQRETARGKFEIRPLNSGL